MVQQHDKRGAKKFNLSYQFENSAKSNFVTLSGAKDLVFSDTYEILRSLLSLRMTGQGTLAEVSISKEKDDWVNVQGYRGIS
jgi:hypothetical protein